MPANPDLLVIGGGVVGLTTALSWRARHPAASVVVLEKEEAVGRHASGRNSGVLHAGFYYTADSLKARFCVEGNRAMTAWCVERGVPVKRCGKLVVARDERDHRGLDTLLARGRANGVELRELSEEEARAIEPRAKTVGRAIFSPTTAAVDPRRVMRSLADACREQGIRLRTGVAWTGRDGHRVRTSDGTLEPGFVLNAAGLQADRVARAWGAGGDYRILPFKGLYLYASPEAPGLACHVYPVPDLDMPFLGVHLTATPDGGSKIGPTALPALWRENYGGLHRFSALELADVLLREARLALTDRSFRKLASVEVPKASRRVLARQAAELVRGIEPSHFRQWGRPGIRAQLLDRRSGKLVMDFVVEREERSLHVLNAVSPAFTCAWSFGAWLAERIPE